MSENQKITKSTVSAKEKISSVGSDVIKTIKNLGEKLPFVNKLPARKRRNYLIALVVIIVAVAIVKMVFFSSGATQINDGSIFPKSQATLNKKLLFPIKNRDGNPTGNELVVNMTTVGRTERVLYNGRPLIARQSKDFLVVNMEVENSTRDRLTIRPIDFIRLVGEDGKNYAPDFQTNPVKVEALSVKKTRTIFIVDDGSKNIVFLLGDLNSEREKVEVAI